MKMKVYRLLGCFVLIGLGMSVAAQADTANVVVTNVSCNGGNNGSILYNITGGPGPIKYTWSNGVTGYATGNCTYAVTLNNPGASLSQFQVRVDVNLAPGMNADFSDIVFIDSVGNSYPFWLTNFPTATSAVFWVRVPYIPPGISVFYLSFCGNAVHSQSDPSSTFEFFEDFDGGTMGAWAGSCVNIDVGGETCNSSVTSAQYFSPGYSLYLTGASSCFTPPYSGAGALVTETVPLVNDSLVVDYEDRATVTLYGYCSGGTSTTNTVFANGVSLGNGWSVGQGGTCATNTGNWRAETSLPFAVTTGSAQIGLQTSGGDCDNSEGWFDDVRIRKYRTYPPVVTLDTTPQLALDSLTAGTYTLTLTDINGNPVTRTITITEPASLQLVIDSANNPCNGSGNGQAWVNVTGGASPYTLLWTGGGSTDTISNLSPGTYTVTVTDNNSCIDSATTHITAVAPLQVSVLTDSVLCYGEATGSAWVVVSGGQAPAQPLWSNSAYTDTITGLTAGVYTVTVTDADNCTASSSAIINQPAAALAVQVSISPITCYGLNNGSAWATTSGGTPGYTYAWSNSYNTDTISNLAAGTYTLTVSDIAGCTATSAAIIPAAPAQLTVTIDSVNISCNGGADGQALAIIAGGATPYSVMWSNNSTANSISALQAGTYTVTVTDSFSCTASSSVALTQPQPINITTTGYPPTCNNANSGSAAALVTGGVSPYLYNWSTGSATDSAVGLSSGTYNLTVSDANSCIAQAAVTVPPAPTISVQQQAVQAACVGVANGSISVQAGGGSSPYTYLWSNGNTTAMATGFASGTVSVTVTDVNGCSAALAGVIPTDNFGITIVAQPDTIITEGDEVTLSVLGANPVSAVWNPIVTFVDDSGLSVLAAPTVSTLYNVVATSGNGCTAAQSIQITIQQKPLWFIPSGFSPNNDGVNDLFHVILKGPVELESLTVYNRWGEKVFESALRTPGWDGTYKNIPQPMGVYAYVVVLKDLLKTTDNLMVEKGNVTLIR
ncbi:MAG TPA: DUF2341 domain-containing protein [Chitinophagales bacterium]|nr:DUF2341 domain-containing protein [Chitinophagales bacterium]